MKRITRWIQEKKAYSNPTFGAMVMLSAMVFPVFQASAQLAEPVQSMVLNGEDVIDAMNAVEAGVSVDEAFNIQPLPYRDIIKTWRSAYEELFDTPLPSGGDAYLLDEEINHGDEGFVFEGDTVNGQIFNIEFASIIHIDINSEDMPGEEQVALNAAFANPLGIIGTLSTSQGSVGFVGSLVQWDIGEVRVREIVILKIVSQEFINDYAGYNINFTQPSDDPSEVGDCDACTASAHNRARLGMDLARIALNGALVSATLWMVGKGILCLSLATVPFIGTAAATSCVFRAALHAAAAAATATALFKSASLAVNAMLRAALEDCYINNPGCRPV